MCAMMWRRTVIVALMPALLLSGCTEGTAGAPDGQAVEIVAGGGSDPAATVPSMRSSLGPGEIWRLDATAWSGC
jgi:hypothetical protein